MGNGPRRRDGVELIYVVQHGGLGGPGGTGLVVRADRVQELGPSVGVERNRSRLDEAETEVHMTEQLSLRRRRERGPGDELRGASDVVQDRRRDEQVRPQTRMELRRLTAESRDADRVLEQATRVSVVSARRGGQGTEELPELGVGEKPAHRGP